MDENLITWGVAGFLWLVMLWLLWPLWRQWRNQQRMERCIASSGVAQLRNVLLEDGMGGMAYFERLLLTPRDIRVLITSSRSGIIFAGDRMDTWAQVIGKRTIRFANPLHGLDALLTSLRFHLPRLMIEGNIVFIADCSFPKGRPERVLTLQDLANEQQASTEQAVQPVLEQAWEKIRSISREVNPSTEGYLLPVRESPSYSRWAGVLVLLVASAGWLLWRLH